MTWKLRHHHCLTALTLALACAAACGDDDGGSPSTTMSTGSSQPMGGSGGSSAMTGASAGTPGAMTGASGAEGAGEAPGMGAMIGMGEGNGMGGAMSTDPACADTGDNDGDGYQNCNDACPDDANKLEAGTCGCGVLDTDIDFDGSLDCQEMCPGDPAKTAPGLCGCGRADVDTDEDGTLDCNEACPRDADRTEPSACGCGADDDLELCLRHRYSFNGMGAVATDSVGDADGDIINATLVGNGTLVLAGGATDQYVNLPAGIMSSLGDNATIETWVTWTGAGGPWQRIFDFGSSEMPAGQQGGGVTYLFVTPTNTINADVRLAYTNAGPPAERVVNGPTPLPFQTPVHIAVVIDGAADTIALYQNGNLLGTAPTLDTTLSLLNDVNNWLGRSQFAADEEFQGTMDEVRIYSAARNAMQIAADFAAGPNDLPAQ